MSRSGTASVLVVVLLSMGMAWSSCGSVRTITGEKPPEKMAIVVRPTDNSLDPVIVDRSRAAPTPLFRKTECRGVCVEIVLAASDDYPFTRRYVESIGRRIILNIVYPWETIEKGAEGDLEIHVKVDRKGTLIAREIYRGSGKPLLDNAAWNSISASAPFNAFPPSPYVQSLGVKANFRYFH
jgi:TonB family protein